MSDPGVVELADINRIERAADTLKAVFLAFRETTWHTNIFDIRCDADDIFIFDDPDKTLRWQGWFSQYPNELTDNPNDKAAVLTTMACYDIAHLRKLVDQMVEGAMCGKENPNLELTSDKIGMDVILEEVMFRVNPPKRRIGIHYGYHGVDPNDYDLWIIRITSRTTGNQWAIDIAGAQYDSHVPCIPWTHACSKLIDKVLAFQPFGTLEKYAVAMAKTKSTDGLETDVQMKAMQAFHAAVDPAMEKKGLSWAAILGKDEKDYVRHRDKILKVGTRAMDVHVKNCSLTKRRLKAERYEKRHFKELVEEERKICQDILGYQPIQVEKGLNGVTRKTPDDSSPPWGENGREDADV